MTVKFVGFKIKFLVKGEFFSKFSFIKFKAFDVKSLTNSKVNQPDLRKKKQILGWECTCKENHTTIYSVYNREVV